MRHFAETGIIESLWMSKNCIIIIYCLHCLLSIIYIFIILCIFLSQTFNCPNVYQFMSLYLCLLPSLALLPAIISLLTLNWTRYRLSLRSYDERPGLRGSQWADTSVLGSRAFYHAHGSPPALLLHRVTLKDGQLYRCRVDFQNTRSRVAWVNLTVIGECGDLASKTGSRSINWI